MAPSGVGPPRKKSSIWFAAFGDAYLPAAIACEAQDRIQVALLVIGGHFPVVNDRPHHPFQR